jgi:hypothetical protein
MSRKVFTAGEVLAAADVNNFLMDQTVMTFAGTAARGSAIGTATEGMVSYLEDIDSLSVFNGTQWITNRPIMTFASTAARGSAIPSPKEGMTTYLDDTDQIEVYNGSTWVRRVSTSLPFAQASGVAYPVTGSSVTVVTLPAGRFTQAPNVMFGVTYIITSGGGTTVFPFIPYLNLPTTTSFGVILSGAGGPVSVYWHAIQMTSASASG